MTAMNEERAGFEDWFAREAWKEGCYGNPDILKRQMWPCWQARAALADNSGKPNLSAVCKAVPYGFMPIPTAEQLAEALENVRSFHDMSAELIAPELLTNLLAALAASTGQEVGKA